jgi:heme-degrading monooxygenase HmoA
MIARRWRVWTREDRAEAIASYLGETGVAGALATPGCAGALLLRAPGKEYEVEFTLMTFWESIDAVCAFAGDDVLRAVTYPRDSEYFTRFDEHVDHVEVVAHDRLF